MRAAGAGGDAIARVRPLSMVGGVAPTRNGGDWACVGGGVSSTAIRDIPDGDVSRGGGRHAAIGTQTTSESAP